MPLTIAELDRKHKTKPDFLRFDNFKIDVELLKSDSFLKIILLISCKVTNF